MARGFVANSNTFKGVRVIRLDVEVLTNLITIIAHNGT
eukprot:CAMPEP_0197067282 /NCGR_PEP_ID=MMETSP1384-20130603/179175_1 /TAXON_ID=29189 /ORGANISM="Ammonia sp." /LENGTH=37 /DNA_ID= /DNA_START= /DNA_END= /DNA_ORIENTATION=